MILGNYRRVSGLSKVKEARAKSNIKYEGKSNTTKHFKNKNKCCVYNSDKDCHHVKGSTLGFQNHTLSSEKESLIWKNKEKYFPYFPGPRPQKSKLFSRDLLHDTKQKRSHLPNFSLLSLQRQYIYVYIRWPQTSVCALELYTTVAGLRSISASSFTICCISLACKAGKLGC